MHCPNCKKESMASGLTTAGVMVNHCEECRGVWLDQGEIFLFSKDPMRLHEELVKCFTGAKPTNRQCPHCKVNMLEGSLFRPDLRIDHCPKCIGLWFDDEELAQALKDNPKSFQLKFESAGGMGGKAKWPSKAKEKGEGKVKVGGEAKVELKKQRFARVGATAARMASLPNLFLRAAGAMAFLYGLLAVALIALGEYFGISPNLILLIGVGAITLQLLLGPFMMDLTLRWLYRCSWVSPGQLPRHLQGFVERVTEEQGMKFPHFGLIDDGTPNAFTYGHTPNNARIVITQGLINLLDEEEVEAVVAHELGHAKHWDMLLMTVASLVPLILYYIFRAITNAAGRVSARSKTSGRGAIVVFLAAACAYIAFIISQYVVLWFSRTREFYADRFAGQVTDNPNSMASALVKVAYGLVGSEEGNEGGKSRKMDAVGALGIFDARAARALAVTAYGLTASGARGDGGSEATIDAMQWDMWNPWAKWHEFHSTHPLVANRLNYLGDQAVAMGWEPYVVFNREKPESYWDEFLVDIGVYALPPVAVIGAIAAGFFTGDHWLWLGIGLFALGYAGLLRVAFRYKSKVFPRMNVTGLLRKVKVSAVRPVPVTLHGRIIGKGVPGLIWSEDFVMQDKTGIIYLDYQQPLAIWEFIFGLLKAKEYAGRDVEVAGWYRRSPVPYLEIKTIKHEGETRRCYALHGKIVTCLAMMIAGGVILYPVMLPFLQTIGLF